MADSETDRVLEKLAKDVEAAVHALYRGEVRQMTAKARTDAIVREAQAALQAVERAAAAGGAAGASAGGAAAGSAGAGASGITGVMQSPRPAVGAPASPGSSAGWSRAEGEAVMKCITAWLPMGSPKDAAPDSRCVAAMRDLTPTWGQRETAREAVRRISQP